MRNDSTAFPVPGYGRPAVLRHLALAAAVMLFALACSGQSGVTEKDGMDIATAEVGADLAAETATELEAVPEVRDPRDLGPFELVPDLPGGNCETGQGCFLDPCTENSDCLSGWCVEHMGAGVCTQACQDECPAGWKCRQVAGTDPDVVFICVSDFTNLCKPCSDSNQCSGIGGADDVCLAYGQEGSFCGGACQVDADCPWGFDCRKSLSVDGMESMQCVAETGLCPCTARSIELGLWTVCEVENEWGSCQGKRVCTASGLSECDAGAALEETCNGLDDDCDGAVDEPKDVGGDLVNLCNDGNDCSKDTCGGEAGCSHDPVDGGECKDGDPCTAGDHCEEGMCVGAPVVCDDKNPCTDDSCDGLGGCQFQANSSDCDDGNPCTVADQCGNEICSGVAIPCDCTADSDCAGLEDGDLCNGTLFCDLAKLPYQCRVKEDTVVTCPPPVGIDAICLAPACDPLTGQCSLVADHDGFACSDGNACTVGDVCTAGKCLPGSAPLCSDDNPCTADSCDPVAGCVQTPAAGPCSDGNACTVGDACAQGECLPGDAMVCDDFNPCTADSCDPVKGCLHAPAAGNCSDGNPCTQGDHCAEGICAFDAFLACSDSNVCTDDSCDPKAGGCVHSVNKASCNDGDVCTLGDQCHLGACLPGSKMLCSDGNSCTNDSCDPKVGCQFVPNTGACDDGNACTTGDSCSSGWCKAGGILACDDGNVCTDDSCDPKTGCTHMNNATPCDDGNACTTADLCAAGKCTGGAPLGCNDGNVCTDDSCKPASGCAFVNVPDNTSCGAGKACVAGQCVGNCTAGNQTFSYTGNVQTFVVPNCSTITVQAYGGAGGNGWNQDVSSTLGMGGKGGSATATITATPGETLYVYVGGKGQDSASGVPGKGGYNGGGNGATKYNYQGGGGGGASDVRRGGTTLQNRVVVAGGGGAGSGWCTAGTGNGGNGGGTTGTSGQQCSSYAVGTGGTQSAGGTFGAALGVGGNATTDAGAGGGGGYYGGGASDGSGGGGGSGFTAAPGNTNTSMSTGVQSGDGKIVISWQ